jgi:hypothetical protein
LILIEIRATVPGQQSIERNETMSIKTFTGSCLCGAVAYTATGESKHFYHCHCSRCRKASGTGHASNMFMKGRLTWIRGEDLVRSYKLPEAKRFTNTFCKTCGSRMPRFMENSGMVFIPAGSLDGEPDIGPMARIFAGSRAAWSCDETRIPEFEEYTD